MFDRHSMLFLVLGVCTVNGIFSPYLNIALPITVVLMPEVFPKNPHWVLFFSSVLVATATLLFSGVPAALYERFVNDSPDDTVSMWIWLGGAVLMTVPAAEVVMRM